jgi:hypothetical protein
MTERANCRRAATAALLAERETLRNRLIGVSPGGDNSDVNARLELCACDGYVATRLMDASDESREETTR